MTFSPIDPFRPLPKGGLLKTPHRLESVLLRLSFFFLFLMGFSLPLSIAIVNISFFSSAGLLILRRILFGHETSVPLKTRLNLPILIYCVVWILAALFSNDPIQSLSTFPRAHHFLLFFLLLWAGGHATNQMFRGYLWGVALCSLVGTTLYLYWTVVDPVGVPAWMSWFGDRVYHQLLYNRYRVYLLSHPMTFTEILLPGFLIFLSFALEINTRLRWVWLGAMVLVGMTLLLTQERGPWVGAMIGTLILVASRPRRALVIVGAALLAFWFLTPKEIKNRLASFGNLTNDVSLQKRVSTWNAAGFVVRQNLWTGVGPGRIKNALEQASLKPNYPGPAKPEPDLHNLYLSELTAKGLFGLMSIFFLFYRLAHLGFSAVRATSSLDPYRHAWGKGLFAFFIAFPIINLTESAFWDAEVALTMWMLAASAFFLTPTGSDQKPAAP